jgi:16S rRNA (guanine527-N7)-methyltransferase
MVDIGTGPGIPGIPLRIIRPDISLTLIDAKRKQISFLAALKRALDLTDVVVLEGRAENLVAEQPALAEAFDVVVARAVGKHLLPVVMLYLKPGGLFIAGGPPAPIGGLAKPDGLLQVRTDTLSLPELRLKRTFLLATKSP